ncbi:hypothetical protein FHX42_001554 [Saccharopolyspora lacisalsi]|uniref:Uncharacterized protein n=1 Tax=Halosaccharopolyspora lacisalsi TaxID=1000566 RepID=A0A839DXY3_9PSEU|nr:hypothetical protein [Halosaccharopolyspora lacisalsi]
MTEVMSLFVVPWKPLAEKHRTADVSKFPATSPKPLSHSSGDSSTASESTTRSPRDATPGCSASMVASLPPARTLWRWRLRVVRSHLRNAGGCDLTHHTRGDNYALS